MAKLRIPLSYKEKDIKRALYDLSEPKFTTLMQGLEIPIKFETLKPGDHFKIDYQTIIDSMPMEGRLLSDYKLRVKCFATNLSNYYSWMDNNSRLTSENLRNRKHHVINPYHINSSEFFSRFYGSVYTQVSTTSSSSAAQSFFTALTCVVPCYYTSAVRCDLKYQKYFGVQPGSVLDYIGIPTGYVSSIEYDTSRSRDMCYTYKADYILAYLDAVRNYLVNNQYDTIPYLYSVPNVLSVDISQGSYEIDSERPFVPVFGSLSLKSIDSFLKRLRMADDGTVLLQEAQTMSVESSSYIDIGLWLCSLRYGGHFCAQYERDMLTGLLRNVSSSNVTIDTTSGSFSINDFRFKNRRQLVEDRFDISGGRWRSLLRTIWGVDNNTSMDIPYLVGVNGYNINPKSILSSANTYNPETGFGNSQGQMSGVVAQYTNGTYQFDFKAKDHCVLYFIVSLIPDVVYSNGLGKGLDHLSFDDEYLPQYDQLGFRDVPRYMYNCLPIVNTAGDLVISSNSGDLYKAPVGKNIAFIDIITNVGRVHGDFARDQYYETWVLKNGFEDDILVPDVISGNLDNKIIVGNPQQNISPYVNPLKYQYPFVVQGSRDNNFVFQIGIKMNAVRPKGKWFMPTLGN